MAAMKTYRSVEESTLTLVAAMHKQKIDWFN